jgi:3-oxoadipate enol-lactonase
MSQTTKTKPIPDGGGSMKAELDGITLAYSDRGDGLPLVLIHGFPLCRKMWRPQAETLSKAGCRVITPDLRGFGESVLTSGGTVSMDVYADDIVALLDYLGIDKAVVGGMSMGGYLLMNLLERYPERVAAPVFIATKAGGDDDAGKARRTALSEACRTQGILPVAEAFRTIIFAPATLADNPELLDEVSGWINTTDPRGAAAALIAMRDRKDCVPLLGSITKPALVICGDQDQAVPIEHSRIIAEGLPDADLCILPGGGHMVNLEQPEEFNKAILRFLARL